jgi:hypothetical protein
MTTTDWQIDHEELKRETIARINEIQVQLERSRARRERRRRRLNRITFGLLGR